MNGLVIYKSVIKFCSQSHIKSFKILEGEGGVNI